ncbi:MAG: TetR family transcriptional regulator [Bacteroidales bacterium]|nr:TetR family transcriptional regulator [Bacteroidales bacterium]
MVIKTREKLIEVARQLFAYKGIENTTMNDIANASEKGRRTIYTYFKNKKEIYNAVIEQESELSVSKLREIITLNITPVEKLRRFLEVRFDIIKDSNLGQNDPLRRFIMRDIKRVEKIRRLALEKEREILNAIIEEGILFGFFDKNQCENFESLRLMVVQGVDFSYIRDNFLEIGIDKDRLINNIIDFIIKGLKL